MTLNGCNIHIPDKKETQCCNFPIKFSINCSNTKYLHFMAIALRLDESTFLDVLHLPITNIKLCDLEATPMGGETPKQASGVVCLFLLA